MMKSWILFFQMKDMSVLLVQLIKPVQEYKLTYKTHLQMLADGADSGKSEYSVYSHIQIVHVLP